ncbi:hypothetical protein [Nonomuraea roseoviolacea]|uniref:DnaJ-class molecular chaperone n=1 Tax=Nonomuraea roseoviolacea subsp. carminata TaxID=160689 RepID=A0ABT1JYW3_9ACTN|nr:hypothetical protein [Nonomuraea roseoviolacea]MCP2346937.1 DnaJ-class molecular chaperone [Nonomuraea roseoviolacea subsp. carminata]
MNFRKNPPLPCPTCSGDGRVIVSDWALGKGKRLVGRKCHVCNGKGTLPTR